LSIENKIFKKKYYYYTFISIDNERPYTPFDPTISHLKQLFITQNNKNLSERHHYDKKYKKICFEYAFLVKIHINYLTTPNNLSTTKN